MKNRKLVKVFSLIAVLAALITCMFVMNVSAETADPEILSTNLVYGDQIQIMFATNVPTTEALGDLKVAYYKKNPATNQDAEVFYATALPADSIYNYKVDDVTYWTFLTDGIPASAVSAERFATAFYGSEIPADATYKTYSVMEYLFTRLYKQDFISKEDGTVDGNKKNLYLKMIDYTAFAQQVLVNDNANIAEDIRLITEYNYVYAKGATINGAGSTLILAGDGEVTLTLNDGMNGFEGWTVNTFNKDGSSTSERVKGTNTFTISAHTVIEPLADPTVIEFDDWATGPVTADSNYRISSFSKGGYSDSSFYIINDNGNTKLQYNAYPETTNDSFHLTAHNSSENANVSVFEMDVDFLELVNVKSDLLFFELCVGEEVVYTIHITQGSNGVRLRLNGTDSNGDKVADDTTTYKKAYGDDSKAVYLAPANYQALGGSSNKDLRHSFTLRIEYYHSVDDGNGGKTGMVKWYLDGVNIGLYSSKMADYVDHTVPVLESGITSVNIKCSPWAGRDMTVNFDNIRVENTEKAYEAYVAKPY